MRHVTVIPTRVATACRLFVCRPRLLPLAACLLPRAVRSVACSASLLAVQSYGPGMTTAPKLEITFTCGTAAHSVQEQSPALLWVLVPLPVPIPCPSHSEYSTVGLGRELACT